MQNKFVVHNIINDLSDYFEEHNCTASTILEEIYAKNNPKTGHLTDDFGYFAIIVDEAFSQLFTLMFDSLNDQYPDDAPVSASIYHKRMKQWKERFNKLHDACYTLLLECVTLKYE